jgi:hypothetical protein
MLVFGSLPGLGKDLSGQQQCPLFPQERTFVKAAVTSVLCQAEALDWTITLPFSQLGGLHGAQWSRSSDLKRILEDQVTTAEFAKRRCDAHGR